MTYFSSGQSCTLDQLSNVITPEGTRTHRPIPHIDFQEWVRKELERTAVRITGEKHGTDKDGARYFGLFDLSIGQDDYNLALGLRNAHDKAFAAGICLGIDVMVCANLSFGGEVNVARKHTANIMNELPYLIRDAIGQTMSTSIDMGRRVAAYKSHELRETEAHDFLIRSLDAGAITGSALPKVLKEWREPTHEEFGPRTLWSLFNGYTEVAKQVNDPGTLIRRTSTLHQLADRQCGLVVAS